MKQVEPAKPVHPGSRRGFRRRFGRRVDPRPAHAAVAADPKPNRLWAVPAPASASSTGEAEHRMPAAAPPRNISLLSLCAATFFIVSGGPYGLEEIVVGHGYARSIGLLILVPFLWSLPVALLVGELSSSLPKEGGYYAWVRRALGPFWGFEEAWLMLTTSLFDMAIYPTLFVTYLGRVWPALSHTEPGQPGWCLAVAMIAACALWNIRGTRAVGVGATVMGVVLLAPFVILIGCAVYALRDGGWHHAAAMLLAPPPNVEQGSSIWLAGILLCMWNYMGWDNASTVAGEVENPQRTYPRAMLVSVALVAGIYVLTVVAAAASGLPPEQWTAGSWVEVARRLGGPALGGLVVLGGALCGLGMFNVLVMTYSRLPVAMAEDGVLPRALARRNPRTGSPTLAIVLAAVLYTGCLGMGLKRLVEIDVMLYGAALALEFVALFVLRLREPELHRPFRIPGGTVGVALLALPPLGLLALASWSGRHEAAALGLSSPQLSAAVMAAGALVYGAQLLLRGFLQQRTQGTVATEQRD
jgi:amino acid transporter